MEGEAILGNIVNTRKSYSGFTKDKNGGATQKRNSFPPWQYSNENNFHVNEGGDFSHNFNNSFNNQENIGSYEQKEDYIIAWDVSPKNKRQALSTKNENLSIEKLSEQTTAFEQFMANPNTLSYDTPFDWQDPQFQVNIFPKGNSEEKNSLETHIPPKDSAWPLSKLNVLPPRRCRTPSPYMFNKLPFSNGQNQPINRRTTFPPEKQETDKYFNSISSNHQVELLVTNLDQNMDTGEMKKNLLALFGEHVAVLHISIFVLSDGNFAASVKVPSLHEAQYAISRLHRRRVGYKKLMISYAHSSHPTNSQFIRWQIISLLRDVPHNKLPLFTFLDLFESRYLSSVSVSELYRLKDVCSITDENGRMVSLNAEFRNSPTSTSNLQYSQEVELHCLKHYKMKQCLGKGWAEQEVPPLPNIIINLKTFTENIYKLLETHNNILPLASFCDCYESEFGELVQSESGVPLEHLVTSVKNVKLSISNSVKYLEPNPHNSNEETIEPENIKSISPKLTNILNIFSRELVDLLKVQPHCQVTFSRFIPAYHHYFGRQCRVADYGFTRLIDLLEALPKVVQVLGEGNRRIVTLSHKTQIRRFTSDLLRVLKVQPSKKIMMSEIPIAFESVLSRPFDPVDYGLCELSDLINQMSENVVSLSPIENDIVIYIPKREQTPQEMERTKVFSLEVIELLSHAPQCTIMFNKFIPAYHHHFGHQCRMLDFGFSKLIELFEAIPDVVKMEEDGKGERKVSLAHDKKLKVLSEQISGLVTPYYPPGLQFGLLADIYVWKFGYALKTETYQASNLEELISNIPTVKVVESDKGKIIIPVEDALVKHLTTKVMRILLEIPNGKLEHSKLIKHFDSFHYDYIKPENLKKLIPDIVTIDECIEPIVELTPLYQFVRKLWAVLIQNEGRMQLSVLESAYFRMYQEQIQLNQLGFPNLQSLFSSIPQVVSLRGKGMKRIVILNRDLLTSKCKLPNGSITCPSVPKNMKFVNNDGEDSKFDVSSPVKWDSAREPLIILPEMPVPAVDVSMFSVFSPCKNLLPPSSRPDGSNGFQFVFPNSSNDEHLKIINAVKKNINNNQEKHDAPNENVRDFNYFD